MNIQDYFHTMLNMTNIVTSCIFAIKVNNFRNSRLSESEKTMSPSDFNRVKQLRMWLKTASTPVFNDVT